MCPHSVQRITPIEPPEGTAQVICISNKSGASSDFLVLPMLLSVQPHLGHF